MQRPTTTPETTTPETMTESTGANRGTKSARPGRTLSLSILAGVAAAAFVLFSPDAAEARAPRRDKTVVAAKKAPARRAAPRQGRTTTVTETTRKVKGGVLQIVTTVTTRRGVPHVSTKTTFERRPPRHARTIRVRGVTYRVENGRYFRFDRRRGSWRPAARPRA